jgi:hypothetical protein
VSKLWGNECASARLQAEYKVILALSLPIALEIEVDLSAEDDLTGLSK